MLRKRIEERSILIGLAGSHAYGLNTASSDEDFRGIFIADKEYYFGFETIEQKTSDWNQPGIFSFLDNTKDTVLFELKKFMELAKNANPNILELLWLNQYAFLNSVGAKLIENRTIFLSQRVKNTYTGYSKSQLAKIQSHRAWLLNPPTKKPIPSEFGIEEEPLSKDNLNAFLEYLSILVRGKIEYLEPAEQLHQLLTADIDFKGLLKQYPIPEQVFEMTQQYTRCSHDFLVLLRKTQQYRSALNQWNAFCEWKKNRNPIRAEMEARCGFDLKHSVHLLRLLRMGTEILNSEELIVDRRQAGDSKELMSIRNGNLSYDEVMILAKQEEEKMEEAWKNTKLPHYADKSKINDFCIELVEMMGW
jgi:predicted nucleotidyltransferase